MASRKSWREKLEEDHPSHGRVVRIPPQMQARFGRGTMVIARPLDIDTIVRGVRKGRLITQGHIRDLLAEQYDADCTCPLTAGIFLRIVAEAAEERLQEGRKRVTPYWRVLRDDGSLNPKFPGAPEVQIHRLQSEGFTVVHKGRTIRVADYQRAVVR